MVTRVFAVLFLPSLFLFLGCAFMFAGDATARRSALQILVGVASIAGP